VCDQEGQQLLVRQSLGEGRSPYRRHRASSQSLEFPHPFVRFVTFVVRYLLFPGRMLLSTHHLDFSGVTSCASRPT
jgi:hypothetical protein